MTPKILPLALVLLLSCSAAFASEPTTIKVNSVVLRLLNEADAPAQDAGVVTEIVVREGQAVREGDLLVRMDDDKQRLAEHAAEVDLAIADEKATNDVSVRYARKAVETAQAELRRSEESVAKFPRSVSQSQLDVERLTIERSKLEQETAEQELKLSGLERTRKDAELDARRLDTARRRITAPIDGVVVEVATRLGEWLEPGQKAMRLVNTRRLKAEGFIKADEASGELVGRKVWISVYPNDHAVRFQGVVVFVSPEIDPINNEVRVWAEVENRAGLLRPGQRPAMIISPAGPNAPSEDGLTQNKQ